MEKIGIMVVAYGSRATSIVDKLLDSDRETKLFIADKQKNPYLIEKAKQTDGAHQKTGLSVDNLVKFAKNHEEDIDFGIVGPEDPIIAGVRDKIEEETNIRVICPTSDYALEGSKVRQRKLIDEVYPEANPEYKIFSKEDYSNLNQAKEDLNNWLDENGIEVAVKPNTPTAGKGVGVYGDHFHRRKELIEDWFLPNLKGGKVIIEEKVRGEEFSIQFISDGKNLVPTPPVRDYKRAFDRGLGPNTGGMGSYSTQKTKLPFMEKRDWQEGINIATQVFKKLRKEGAREQLRGVPLYVGYICTRDGVKLFEINSRFGDPECQNIMALLENDLVEVCIRILKENLNELNFKDKRTALTYAVPPTYGNAREKYSGNKTVKLKELYELKQNKYGNKLKIHQGNLIKKDKTIKAGTSRSICTVGVSDTIKEAREISLNGIKKIDGALWNRWDIASEEHINESIQNIRKIRR
ncbi:hypothetical protein C9439_07745 [archaeon SCG-AAA382B04]|nr:hypothetical protein C9439_07745 [archaeon SCG-AAA382B04]